MNDLIDQKIEFIVNRTVEELQRRGMLKSSDEIIYNDASRLIEEYYKHGASENFSVIPIYFKEGKTLEAIAVALGVDVSTIVRNKKRLCLAIYNEIS